MNKGQLVEKMTEVEKYIKVTEAVRTEAMTKEKLYTESLKEKEEALKELGTTPEEAESKIKKLEDEIAADLVFIEENLPIELLKKWGKL